MANVRKIASSAPQFIRTSLEFVWGRTPYVIKFGAEYEKRCKWLAKTQFWSAGQHKEYTEKKLNDLICYSYNSVPFYKEAFDGVGFVPLDNFDIEQFESLPFTDKNIVNENGKKMVSRKYDEKQIDIGTTGGTSGIQTRFYREKNSYAKNELPYVNMIWGCVGYERGKSRLARFRNDVLPAGKVYNYDFKNREFVIDSYHLTDDNIRQVLDFIVDKKIEYLHTYPSNALVLCDYIIRKKINYKSSLKAVLATSENLYPGQKEKITKYLARCFTFYGHSEGAGIAGWCEYSDKYHVISEYGYIELIDDDGKVIHDPGVVGEIVCTGFNNYVAPLIRYRTGDYAKYSNNQKCKCGRHYVLLDDIMGRWNQECFIGKDGNKISMAAVNMHGDVFDNVKNYQFIQEEKGKCIIHVVKESDYSQEDESRILDALKDKMGDSMEIAIEYVTEIERTKRGKQQFIMNRINMNNKVQ